MLIAPLAATIAGIGGSLALMWEHFAVGGALLLASVLALRWPRSIWRDEAVEELPPRTRWLALAGVCAVAAFFRVYRLNQPGLWGDDAINGLLALDILAGKIDSPFQIVSHSHSSFHALSNYPIAAAFRLFGADITTLRLPGVVLGTLCVPLLYATIAPLFGSSVALVAAFFYASSPPQLTHAKQLVQIITGQFFLLAGLALLVRGIARNRRALIAASGLPLAGCVYAYHSARLAPLVAAIYALAALRPWQWATRWIGNLLTPGSAPADRGSRSRQLAIVFALAIFAVALVPALVGYLRNPAALVQRVSATSIWPLVRDQHSLLPLWRSVWRTLLMFHYQQGPEYHWFGVGTDPAVNAVIGFLFVHGLVESLLRWRQPRHLLLLTWFLVGLLPALLSTGAPRLYRALLGTPPLYVWAALPVMRLAASSGARNWSRAARRALAVGLIAAVPLIDFNYYFYHVYTHPLFRWFQGERIVEMARTLRGYGPGWTGYLLADNFDAAHETFAFLGRAWGLDLRGVSSLGDVLPLHELPERGALFIMSHGALGAAPAIEAMYPGQELLISRDVGPRSWWLDPWWPLTRAEGEPRVRAGFYPVPRAAADEPRLDPPWGLTVEFDADGRRRVRREPYPYYAFLAPAFPQRFEGVWSGRLIVPEPGGYHLDVESNADPLLFVDGRSLSPKDALPAGEHEFRLQIRNVPPSPRLALYWRRAEAAREPIPPRAFAPADGSP